PILVGDFYFAKAYSAAAQSGVAAVVAELASAVMQICTGELEQQKQRYHYHQPRSAYAERIHRQTGVLMMAACRMGGLVADLDHRSMQAVTAYGRELGQAFQIADDVLDYTGEEAEMGKPVGHDLLEGSATLPL